MSESKGPLVTFWLVELMNLTFERELVAGGTQMSNSLHQESLTLTLQAELCCESKAFSGTSSFLEDKKVGACLGKC